MKNVLINISMLLLVTLGFSQELEKPIIPSNKLVYGVLYINIKDEAFSNRGEIYSGYFGYEYHTYTRSSGSFMNQKNATIGFHFSYPINHALNKTVNVKYKSWNFHFIVGEDITKSVKFDFCYMYGLEYDHSSLYLENNKTRRSDDDLLVNLSNILRYNFNLKSKRPIISVMMRYGINVDLFSTELLFNKNNIHPMIVPYVQFSLGYVFGPK